MATVERNVLICAPIDVVFSYITDPMNKLEWLPSLTELTDVNGYGVGMQWDWSYKMFGLLFKGKAEVTEYITNKHYVFMTSGGVKSAWIFSFRSEYGGTRMYLEVEYIIPMSVLGKVAQRLVLLQNERESDLAMENIKTNLGDRVNRQYQSTIRIHSILYA
jgi:ligand-binding SRPBCC domain-containing protein